jgi:hypothetical protein
MTYKMSTEITAQKSTRMIELSLSADQSAAAGDTVAFNVLSASHADHGVSIDASGNITLHQRRSYWVQASIDVSRGATGSGFTFAFYDNATGTQISVSDGGFPATWVWHNKSYTGGQPNATFTANYVSLNPLGEISLRAQTLVAGSSVLTGTRIIIIEGDQ